MPEITLQQRATYAAGFFETAKRNDGETYYRTTDNRPKWLQALCMDAHDDMMPDDTKYEYIVDALENLAENGDDDDRAREWVDSATDVYNHDLTAWLHSHNGRMEYCTRAVEDGLLEAGAPIDRQLAVGQYLEREEVLHSVKRSLEALDDDDFAAI